MKAKERKARFNALSQHGCCICLRPAEIHHLLGIKYSGMGQKADDEYTIPLCVEHHRGHIGIHHLGQRKWESIFGEQEYHLQKIAHFMKKT